MSPALTTRRNPWLWIPTLYMAEGVPYVVVMTVSVILYKNLGLSNTDIALYTSWLYLPFVIKPLWSPVVDLLKTRRQWVWVMELIVGAGLAGVALTIPTTEFVRWTMVCFWLLAFSGATHDVAADGFYLLGTTEREQAFFIGIRGGFFNISKIAAQGLLVMLAGAIQENSDMGIAASWIICFFVLAATMILFGLYHLVMLTRPEADQPGKAGSLGHFFAEFFRTFGAFFRKEGVGSVLCFLLLYRFAESQLVKMSAPFLLDPAEKGGLGLSTGDVGFVYGTVGIIALLCGGVIGGIAISRHGLRTWLWPMACAIQLPNAVYAYLAYAQPDSLTVVGVCVAVEQLGYGFGFAAYMFFMVCVARGPHATAHFAICTGFMALGMMVPGMWSGWLQETLGYQHFFLWVMVSTIPGFAVVKLVRVEVGVGKRA